MKKWTHFVGIDVSKLTMDVALLDEGKGTRIVQEVFSNDKQGFSELKNFLSKQKASFGHTLFCLEHTGYYSRQVAGYIQKNQGDLWMEMSLKIIRSLGVQRGKSDKLDARRIAQFAQRNQQDFIPYQAPRPVVATLKTLLMLRDKLIRSRSSFMVPINELLHVDKTAGKMALRSIAPVLKTIKTNLQLLDHQIDELIRSDQTLSTLFALVTSVPGVARVTFCHLAYYTNEFRKYSQGKQLACYCGVVPFEHTSGSSVRGKPKVHNMANKRMKRLLHMAALCAVSHYPEFKQYYERKVKEGKNKMLILNNVRNKIVLRIAAVVKNQQKYKLAA